ncbi:MAG: NADPH-dependent 7-cyano-7-deazaguanine reductase QueF [Nitrospirae bacterium]|nr:NADPH-dependent 7-cyano-7-deazaguanine reductase QueF [Nitrospirota bacterium]
MSSKPRSQLEIFPNPYPRRDYSVRMDCPEFTSVCPKTGQPDFGRIEIEYVPDRACIELKSLKLYLWSYREQGIFYETVTNRILEDLVRACRPRWMRVTGRFNVRGGISTDVVVEYRQRGKSGARARG